MGVRRRSTQRQQRRAATANEDTAPAGTSTQIALKTSRVSAQIATPKLTPTFNEVLAAIESMYADELKPFGRLLRKRVAEHAAGTVAPYSEDSLADVDVKHLRETCEQSKRLRVEPEEGGDWSVIIIGRSQNFVDVYSSVDAFPTGMWGAAAAYFQLLAGDTMYLPGGRYSCAQALQARGLAFLEGRSLGQVCHLVQLAISQKKLLGYLNGAVVPYAYSQSMLKEQCAQLNAPLTETEVGVAVTKSGLEMATWSTAREYLQEILNNAAKADPENVGTVPLSNVKRLFRSKFHTDLSETKLGHSKLSELLQDDRFSDICTVQLAGHGYVVVQVMRSIAHTLPESVSTPKFGKAEFVAQAEDTESTVDSGACSAIDSTELSQNSAGFQSRRPSLDDPVKVLLRVLATEQEEADLLDRVDDSEPRHRLQFCLDEPLALEELGQCLTSAPMTMTPTNMYSPWLSSALLQELCGSEILQPATAHESCRRLQFCPDEPLTLEEAGCDTNPPEPRWVCQSPSSLSKCGRVGSIELSRVQNTFIHSPLAPPTPCRAARSRSLPKDVGSHRNTLEATCQALGYINVPCLQQESNALSPSPYAHYMTPNMLPSFAPEQAFVPASPALAGLTSPAPWPTYSCSAFQFGGVQKSLPLISSLGHHPMVNDYTWPAPTDEAWPVSSDSSPFTPPNVGVLSLASLLQCE